MHGYSYFVDELMAVVEGQRNIGTTSSFKHATRQRVTAVGGEQKYPVRKERLFDSAGRLPVTAKGNEQRYPALSFSRRAIKTAVIANGTKLIVAASDVAIRKIEKRFGQLFP